MADDGISIPDRRQPVNKPRSFEPKRDPSLPEHLIGVANPHQTAVCDDCGHYIFVTGDNVELGHKRVGNSGDACPHRPGCVEPRDHGGGR